VIAGPVQTANGMNFLSLAHFSKYVTVISILGKNVSLNFGELFLVCPGASGINVDRVLIM
jgi:hypothetical protein